MKERIEKFKHDWQVYSIIDIADFKHFGIAIDKEYLGICIEVAPKMRFAYIKLLCMAFRFWW